MTKILNLEIGYKGKAFSATPYGFYLAEQYAKQHSIKLVTTYREFAEYMETHENVEYYYFMFEVKKIPSITSNIVKD